MCFEMRVHLARALIDRVQAGEGSREEQALVLDLATEHGQLFDNVAHMRWFAETVAESMESREVRS